MLCRMSNLTFDLKVILRQFFNLRSGQTIYIQIGVSNNCNYRREPLKAIGPTCCKTSNGFQTNNSFIKIGCVRDIFNRAGIN